jgi:hypothetical protein
MDTFAYAVRGFLTIRTGSLRVPLRGSLAVVAHPDSGAFTGDLELAEATTNRALGGATVAQAAVRITAESPVIGHIDADGRMFAAVSVHATITAVRMCGRSLLVDGSCRTTTQALVPLRSQPGFDLRRGGRVAGRYHRPPFTGCGWLTPAVNLLVAGSGNAVVIDLIPRP